MIYTKRRAKFSRRAIRVRLIFEIFFLYSNFMRQTRLLRERLTIFFNNYKYSEDS